MTHNADTEALVHEFDRYRPVLFGLAYRMLGSAMDAEDILQEAFLRWQQSPRHTVQSPRAFLMTIVTRLCLDALRAARTRREHYVGPWLPEPLVSTGTPDPTARAEQEETLSFAFLLLLERLTPLERAVFILHEVFGYSYDEIAGLIGSNGPHCRQLGHRARQRLSTERPRFRADPAQAEQAARAFARACAAGDLQGLLAIFAHDIALWTDGGGKARAARNIIYGADRVARFFVGIMRKAGRMMTFERACVNGQPGLLVWIDGRLDRVYAFDFDARGRIQAVYGVLNPDKLCGITRG
ncbi:RNA polymerase sigma-70 factor [Litorilinea aerophila]|uniref:RNA polymerase sigma-70 factor n=1 Tax=Litorilinea aerophila TaxID=1204385 RepID=A0A540VI78_9CHLR|nr:RNA polymerase sigma-70 factor [Litorilinea aerophila]MCC9076092.1 RNA polymerase sigma-70 factor [Litorilinea aerophila]